MRVGPYRLHGVIASGGFGQVEYATREATGGFSRVVAVKRVRTDRLDSEEAVAMLLDEARLVSRIHHPNVVSVLDVIRDERELFVVMEYVDGETLAYLQRVTRERGELVPPSIVVAIVSQVLAGLHAAHEARDEAGMPLGIVHRDVSPQNVMIGADGVARVLDFGVAKAHGRLQRTATGEVKGKLAYMAPEQLAGEAVSRAADLYGVAVMLWELVTGRRLFDGLDAEALVQRILVGYIEPPSKYVPSLSEAVERVIMQGLSREPAERFSSAREMGRALTSCAVAAAPSELGTWVEARAAESLMRRRPEIDRLSTIRDAATEASATVREAGSATHAGGERLLARRRSGAARALVGAALLAAVGAGATLAARVMAASVASSDVRSVDQVSAASALSRASPPPTLDVVPDANDAAVASEARDASEAARSVRAPPRSVPRKAPGRTSPARDECDIPFFVDTRGQRTYKRECLSSR